MKFCILCIGSHGDIRPYIALGVALKKKGHDVRIASHAKAKFLCTKYDLDFFQVDGDLTELMQTERGKEVLWGNGGKIAFLKDLMIEFKKVLRLQLPMSLDAAQGTDVLIYSPAAFAGPHLSEYLGIPSFLMNLQPDFPTKHFPSCLFPKMQKFGAIGCLLSYFLADQQFWLPIRSSINRWRRQTLKLGNMHIFGPKHDSATKNTPRVIACAPNLVPRPTDWPPHIQMTGFCRLMEGTSWQPSENLLQFMQQKVELYLSFGSLNDALLPSLVTRIVNVLIKKQIRTIIHSTLVGLNQNDLPDWIFPLDYVPHDWLLPQVTTIVHHGGIGTTSAGLYAGCPTLIMPFVVDQFFWGDAIERLKLGPTPLPIKSFDEETFSQRLEDLLHNADYQKNASKMKEQLLQSPDGSEMAVNCIFSYLASK